MSTYELCVQDASEASQTVKGFSEFTPAVAEWVCRIVGGATGTWFKPRSGQIMNICELAPGEYEFIKSPLAVVVEFLPEEVLVGVPELEIYGEGVDSSEAVADLKNELIDLFEDLNGTADEKLGKIPKSWKRIINMIIRKV